MLLEHAAVVLSITGFLVVKWQKERLMIFMDLFLESESPLLDLPWLRDRFVSAVVFVTFLLMVAIFFRDSRWLFVTLGWSRDRQGWGVLDLTLGRGENCRDSN